MDIVKGNQQRPLSPRTEGNSVQSTTPNRRRKSLRLRYKIVITSVLVSILALLALYMVPKMVGGQQIDSTKYQVVYLSNGQAYFGKLQNTTGPYMVMKTPYTAQGVKTSDSESNPATTTLLKVSAQVYGPEDSMAIRTDQVAFWQNLRDDSKVTKAIDAKE